MSGGVEVVEVGVGASDGVDQRRQSPLIVSYLLNGQGGGRAISWREVELWSPGQEILWVHLNYRSSRAVQWLHKRSGLDKITANSMTIAETRPRSVIYSNGLFVSLRGVNLNPGQAPEDMVSIRIWIDQNRIITTGQRHLKSIEDICALIGAGKGPKSTVEFLKLLNEYLINRMADVLESIDEQVDELEQEVLTTESHLLRPKIADLRRQCIAIRRYLAPQRDALGKLYHEHEKISLLNEFDKMQLRESAERIIRFIENLDAARERAAITQEELTSRLSEQLDSRMYMLSIVAVIFLPLTFITGLLGVNLGGIPGANYKWAFLLLCIILIALLFTLFLFFRRKQWI